MASRVIAQAARKSRALGPSVKNLLAQYQLDLSQIVSTGPHQTLLKGDVLAYISQKKLKPNDTAVQRPQNPPAKSATPVSSSQPSPKVTLVHVTDKAVLKSKYARKYPTQHEIDVINAGGSAAI